MHVFITGEIGAGKSTVIRGILERAACPVFGFVTQKGPESPAGRDITMRPAAGGAGVTVARCASSTAFSVDADRLNALGEKLLLGIPEGALVLMDELGFLESQAPGFCARVLATLDRNVTVLGAIKPLSLPFLNAVRGRPDVRVFPVFPKMRSAARALAEDAFFRNNPQFDPKRRMNHLETGALNP